MKNSANHYESRKVETLLKCGFPKKELWLTELTSGESAIQFYGHDSEIAEIVKDAPFVLYYHEAGTVHAVEPFADESGFQKACENLSRFFNS